jgi:hypothetical protein
MDDNRMKLGRHLILKINYDKTNEYKWIRKIILYNCNK